MGFRRSVRWKGIVRRALGEKATTRLALARAAISTRVAQAISLALKAFPQSVLVRIKQDLALTRPLDYSPSRILMNVESLLEFQSRVNACAKEPETVEWIETFVRAGDVVFDIGANVGAYGLVMDRHARAGATIFAFEPSFSTFAELNRNVLLNGCAGRVVPLPVALSATTGLATLNYSAASAGAALHALGEAIDNKGRPFVPAFSQPVLSYRLDDLLESFGLPAPNHIKLDVDGIELEVLRGAERTLVQPAMRTILIELEPGLPSAQAVLQFLTDRGFVVRSKCTHGSLPTDTTNYVFERRDLNEC